MAAKRTYNSTRRKEQARQTRRQIVEAARELFQGRGYTGATIEAIAARAGVAAETVYAAFGSKQAILQKLIEVSIVGDDDPTPLLERPGPMAVRQETDPRRQIELFAQDMDSIMSRMAPNFMLMRSAGYSEPEIRAMLEKILSDRLGGMLAFVRMLMKNGPLRSGLTPHKAAETVWALTSGEMFTLLRGDRGWTSEEYLAWLTDSLTRLLLD